MPISGTFDHGDGRPTIRFARTFPHPPAAVWAAISRPDQLEKWFPTTVEFGRLRAGEPIAFRFTEVDFPPMSGEIQEVSEPHRLAFSWGDDLLSFDLEPTPEGDGCRLSFTVALDAAGKAARDGAGWEECLDGLGDTLGGRTPRRSDPTRWAGYYEAYKQHGFPATAPIPEGVHDH